MAISELVNHLVDNPNKGKRGIRTLKPFQQEQVKQHIQTTQILKRVQDYALGELDMDYPRVQACFKLLEFRLSKAIPDAVTNNLQANTALALQSIQQAQLMLMAKEMLEQGHTLEHEDKPVLIETDIQDNHVTDSGR